MQVRRWINKSVWVVVWVKAAIALDKYTLFFIFLGWNQQNLMCVKMKWKKWNMKMEFLSQGKCWSCVL